MKVLGYELKMSSTAGRSSDKDYEYGYASKQATKSNPIMRSIQELSSLYQVRTIDNVDYVRFGTNDDVPEILDKLSTQSPTHSGILSKKAKMVAGNGINWDEADITTGNKSRVKALMKYIGTDKDVQELFLDMAYSYEQYGAVPLLVKINTQGRLVNARVLPVREVRAGVPTESGSIKYWVHRRYWQNKTAYGHPKVSTTVYKTYKKNSKGGEYMIYVRNPFSTNSIYGTPNYLSAYYFITSDYEFGKHIDNSVKNGFSPAVIATFVARNMSADKKAEAVDNLKRTMTGTDGDKISVNFVGKIEDKPDYDILEAKNLDKTIATMSELNDAKILTAHNVTSPQLFGIAVAGKLGGTGEELITAYYIFRNTETLPNRSVLLKPLNELLDASGYGIQLEVEDFTIEKVKVGEQPVIEGENDVVESPESTTTPTKQPQTEQDNG